MDPASSTPHFVPVLELTPPATGVMVFSEGSTVFGRLQLLRKLGEGRSSSVWLAYDPRFRRQIALKVFRTEAHEATEEERRLWRELLRRLRIVDHRNMVMPLEFYGEMGFIAIAGAFVDGATLAELLRQRPEGRFGFAEARKWIVQIGLAMAAAHTKAKIIHGNLNAFNVLINPVGDAKICDFGFHPPISATPEDVDRSDILLKLACVSPERFSGGQPSFSDDIYAFGALAFQLLIGRNPARGTPDATSENAAALRSAENLPDVWRALILAALSEQFAERPVSFVAMIRELAPEEFHEEMDAQKAVHPEVKTTRRHRKIMTRGSRRRRARNALIVRILLVASAIALPLIIYRTISRQREADRELTAQRVLAEQIESARLDAEKARNRELEFQLALESATKGKGAGIGSEASTTPPQPKPLAVSTSARTFFGRAQAAVARGDFKSAMTNYDLAVVLQPDWPELLETRGFALLKGKRAEAAIADFNKALAIDPTRVNALLGRAQASQALGDANGARQDFEAVLKIEPDSADAKTALNALRD
ncbi:MAG TPA: protein kinase [Chthoniobacterales bacterium]